MRRPRSVRPKRPCTILGGLGAFITNYGSGSSFFFGIFWVSRHEGYRTDGWLAPTS